MTKILILVCTMSTPVEDCTPMNAISAARGPNVQGMSACGLFGQSQIAQSSLTPHEGEYEKIVCSTGGAG